MSFHSDHSASHSDSPDVQAASSNLALAFFLNLFFCLIEAIGGVLTNSVAILSDALHDVGDSLSLGVAWYFQRVSRRHPDKTYTYGYQRFSVLSALINGLVLIAGSVFIITESVRRFMHPAEPNTQGMIILAFIGILVNGAAALRLTKGKSLNERLVSIHLFEDVFGWLAVLIGSVTMTLFKAPWIDPLLSLGISAFILYQVVTHLKDVLRVMLQGKPTDVDEQTIKEALLKLPHVTGLHDLHIWSLDQINHQFNGHPRRTTKPASRSPQAVKKNGHRTRYRRNRNGYRNL
jgi:cobalt-zinc-cadmium efflux system protein